MSARLAFVSIPGAAACGGFFPIHRIRLALTAPAPSTPAQFIVRHIGLDLGVSPTPALRRLLPQTITAGRTVAFLARIRARARADIQLTPDSPSV